MIVEKKAKTYNCLALCRTEADEVCIFRSKGECVNPEKEKYNCISGGVIFSKNPDVNIITWSCPCGKKNTFDLNKYKSIVKRGYLEIIFDAKLCPKCFVKSLKNKGDIL